MDLAARSDRNSRIRYGVQQGPIGADYGSAEPCEWECIDANAAAAVATTISAAITTATVSPDCSLSASGSES